MEKQPVDDLFARKLRDAEAPVGPDIFDQLQKRMGAKPLPVRRPVVAWWHVASAACVLIALGFIYTTNSASEKIGAIVALRQPARKETGHRALNNTVAVAPVPKQQNHPDLGTDGIMRDEKLLVRMTYPDRKPVVPTKQSIVKEPTPTRLQPQPTEQIAVVRVAEIQHAPETQSVMMKPTVPVNRIEQVANSQKQPVGRTIVLTIEEPRIATALAATQSDSPVPQQQQHQNGLSGLLGKLKQLKNGEVLAKAIPAASSQNSQKNRLGRVFSEVKESLKNETTLE